jgi:hypothetical protein
MEVFTIDQGTNRRSSIIEYFESFIWTERYDSYGDFQIVAEFNPNNVEKLQVGSFVGFDQSDRIMVVKKVTKEENSEGRTVLKVSGKSLESIFEDRVAKISLNPSDWTLVGSAGSIARTMVYNVCIAGLVSYKDIIFGLDANTWPSGTERTVAVKAGNLYERLREVCGIDNLGFKITYDLMMNIPLPPPGLVFYSVIYNAPLHFVVYSGVDRTTGYQAVSFSDENDTLFKSTTVISEENYKNVAYVYSNTQSVIVDEINPPALHPGFTHKPLLVDATDVTTTGTSGIEILKQRGRQALTEHRKLTLVDGQVNPDGMFIYKTHYNLGDIVLIKSNTGESQPSRVTEHIWTYDSDGLNGYPTLTAI